MVKLAKAATPAKGMKLVNRSSQDPYQIEVPEDTVIGRDCVFDYDVSVGEGCILGDQVHLSAKIGDNVTIGDESSVKPSPPVGNNVTIGKRTVIRGQCDIEDGVSIGDDVVIEGYVVIRTGVVVPSNWLIRDDCVVNPGHGGFPVVIVTPPTFRCKMFEAAQRGGATIY